MSKCELCGEEMPAGEEMFKYHGLSGDCPKPPLVRENFIKALKRFLLNATGVTVDVRVENGEVILIDPAGQQFKSGLVRKH